ncbi:MAG: glycosyltransferase family 39 protein [Acidobacteriia bacterium]|nr:glycosyltransferase family 39 protein [Terriglobia bacterium]
MPTPQPTRLFALQSYSIIFVAILLLHAPLLRLPFFWDEAGFYVPAAHDLAQFHSVIARTTIDTGHPPLSAAYLALWFTLSGWKPAVARIAMLLLAAFALTNVFLLTRRIASHSVAVASTIATAIYPVFFAQSSLAHADLTAAAFALWGIRLGIERRLWMSQLAFSLAVLSKETAIIIPAALALWELLPGLDTDGNPKHNQFRRALIRMTPLLPLLCWLLYHHHATGRFFGNADFYQYNVTSALSPLRFLIALLHRTWHLLGIMNMLVMTAAMAAAMFFLPVSDNGVERKRIAIPVQIQFACIMLAHLIAFSLVGGALLTRYLLAAYPLVIILGMSTLRRRIARWQWPAAGVIAIFALALFVDPPYKFAPEDNLTYKDFVELHVRATSFLQQHEQGAAILTAWPATDELTHPYLGYVKTPLPTVAVENFTVEGIYKARQMRSRYQVAYLFSTKYNQPTWFLSRWWEGLHRRYFDEHTDVDPETAANILEGKIVFVMRKKAEWVAVVEIESGRQSAVSIQPRSIP